MELYLHEPQKLRNSFLHYRLTPHTPKGISNRIGTNGSCLRKPTVFSDVTTSVQSVENGHSKTPMNERKDVGAASARGDALGPRTVPDPKLGLSEHWRVNE